MSRERIRWTLGTVGGGVLALSFGVSAAVQQTTVTNRPEGGDQVRTVVAELDGGVGGVAVDKLGFIFVADFRERVYKVSPDGRVSIFATGLYGSSGNAVDARGRLLQSSFSGDYVTRIDRDGTQTIVAEGLGGPVGIAINPDDESFVVCNCRTNSLSLVTAGGQVSTFAESPLLNCPNGIVRSTSGDYFVVNFRDGRMLKVSADGKASEFAVIPGGGNGHVTLAAGGLYVTSLQGHRVYHVTLDGTVSLLAGTGAIGEGDGPARTATFSWPNGIAAGPAGDRVFINDFVNRFPPSLAAPPAPRSSLRQITFLTLPDKMTQTLADEGLEAMVAVYRTWKSDSSRAAQYTELDVNALGYRLLGEGRTEAAIAVFTLNVESYPSSANVFDSLGEAYMKAGQNARAIENYEKSLALNPGNTNAVAMLKILRGR